MKTRVKTGRELGIERLPRHLLAFLLPVCFALLVATGETQAESPALDFNRDIRPILAENCFYCHGQDANKRQAELRLDVRDAAIEAGAIVPKDPASSELIARINAKDSHELMPPPKSNRRLSAEQKKRLERWIEEGANVRPALGLRRAQSDRPSPRCGEPTGCGIRSTGSCSRSSKPKGCHRRPRPTGPPSSSGSRST